MSQAYSHMGYNPSLLSSPSQASMGRTFKVLVARLNCRVGTKLTNGSPVCKWIFHLPSVCDWPTNRDELWPCNILSHNFF
jgi:hypothetical protein